MEMSGQHGAGVGSSTSPGILVQLTWYEILQAATAGVMRRVERIRQGKNDVRGWDPKRQNDRWTREVESAAGEMAFAKWSGKYWGGSVNAFQGQGDVQGIEVRTCFYENDKLTVRPYESKEAYFVLVIGRCPDFRIMGWMRGIDAMQDRWYCAPNDGSPCWMVPKECVTPFKEKKRATTT